MNSATYYSIYSAKKDISPEKESTLGRAARRGQGPNANAEDAGTAEETPEGGKPNFIEGTKIPSNWDLERPELMANAMVKAGDKLFMSGPPDVADEEKTFDYVFGAKDKLNLDLEKQAEAWKGAMGAILWSVNARSGEKSSELRIPSIPVWDGIIAVNGRLYMALKDGTIMCLG